MGVSRFEHGRVHQNYSDVLTSVGTGPVCKTGVRNGQRGSIPHTSTTGTGSDSGLLPSEGREGWCKSTVPDQNQKQGLV